MHLPKIFVSMFFVVLAIVSPGSQSLAQHYPIVDTGQTVFYDNTDVLATPSSGDSFYGQDAQFAGNQPSYTANSNGEVVQDNVTGLNWTQSIDWDGAIGIDIGDKFTRTELNDKVEQLNNAAYGGITTWRVPTVKELYSLIQFNGIQPAPNASTGTGGEFFLDGSIFDFSWGDTAAGDRIIDSQVWSSTDYSSTTMNGDSSFLSVNFADGRIKGYPLQNPQSGADKEYYGMFVAGNTDYGINDFQNNGDGTLTDDATSLMWTQNDSSLRMDWEDALAYAQAKNGENYLGHDDWRLPNAKELQSLVDYSRSPDATGSPAIDPLFQLSATELTAGDFTAGGDYGYHWTGTTFSELNGSGVQHDDKAVYISFFETLGMVGNNVVDSHGAGAQRTDPKTESAEFSSGDFFGPQGDYISIFNYVLLVRDVPELSSGDFDTDGDVDGGDFLAWQNGFGISDGTATKSQGDANGDGNVDGVDFLAWQNQFGNSSGAGAAAVPEPASAALLFILAAAGMLLRFIRISDQSTLRKKR